MNSLTFTDNYILDLNSKIEYSDLDIKEKLIIQNTKLEITIMPKISIKMLPH